MDDFGLKILFGLLENEHISFRQLQQVTEISPNTLKKHLDLLKRSKLVHEEGRNIKENQRGKKFHYSLTGRGKDECLREAVRNANYVLGMLHRITTAISEEDLDGYWEYRRKHDRPTTVNEPYVGEILLAEDESYSKEWIREAFNKLVQAVCDLDVALNTQFGSRELNRKFAEETK